MFETVFVYSDGLRHGFYLSIILVCISLIGLFLIPAIKKKDKGKKFVKLDSSTIYLIAIPFFLLLAYLLIYIKQIDKYSHYGSIYHAGQYKITEGYVKVLFEQPYKGHGRGDLIEVNGVKFIIDYYTLDLLYRKTVSHGGYLHNGVYAKIYYSEKQILRIDIKKIKSING